MEVGLITLTTRVQTPAAVIATALLDDEMVLLHLETQHYYTLNETGSHLWRDLAAGLSLAEASHRLGATYGLTPEAAAQTTVTLVQELMTESLLQPVATSG